MNVIKDTSQYQQQKETSKLIRWPWPCSRHCTHGQTQHDCIPQYRDKGPGRVPSPWCRCRWRWSALIAPIRYGGFICLNCRWNNYLDHWIDSNYQYEIIKKIKIFSKQVGQMGESWRANVNGDFIIFFVEFGSILTACQSSKCICSLFNFSLVVLLCTPSPLKLWLSLSVSVWA